MVRAVILSVYLIHDIMIEFKYDVDIIILVVSD